MILINRTCLVWTPFIPVIKIWLGEFEGLYCFVDLKGLFKYLEYFFVKTRTKFYFSEDNPSDGTFLNFLTGYWLECVVCQLILYKN